MKNRSVPAEAILPHINYEDLARAIEWLSRSFGIVEHYRYGQPVPALRCHWAALSSC